MNKDLIVFLFVYFCGVRVFQFCGTGFE